MDREEFFRLKKVQGKKKRDAERANKERKEANEAAPGGGPPRGPARVGGG
jgi:V-type H+-transporting ATPase subunit D